MGRGEILGMMFKEGMAFGGTFNGNPLSLAASLATLTELAQDGGEPLKQANKRGEEIMRGIQAAAYKHDLPLLVTGFGTAFALHFTQRSNCATIAMCWKMTRRHCSVPGRDPGGRARPGA